MAIFDRVESPEKFKDRLNCLTEKLNEISKNTIGEGAAVNQRIQSREA